MVRPSSDPPQHTFRILGTTYQCHLHPVRCAQPGCGEWTLVHPMCARHAKDRMGVQIRRVRFPRSGAPRVGSCGLFATRAFAAGDPIAPYLGRRCPSAEEWHCPHSRGTAEDSGYSITDPGSDGKAVFDCSCARSYAAMSNHAPRGRHNAIFTTVNAAEVGRICRHRHRCGLQAGAIWLVADAPIPAGAEIRVNYGPQGRHLVGIRSRTVPPLC